MSKKPDKQNTFQIPADISSENIVGIGIPEKPIYIEAIGDIYSCDPNILREMEDKFINGISASLNEFADNFFEGRNLYVQTKFFLDPAGVSGNGAFTAILLKGESVTVEDLEMFKHVLFKLSSRINPQQSLFSEYSEPENVTEKQRESLTELAQEYARSMSGMSIKNPFTIQIGMGDGATFPIRGKIPLADPLQARTEAVEFIAWSNGYFESNNRVFLSVENKEKKHPDEYTLECAHSSIYETLCRARLANSPVHVQVLKSYSSQSTKPALHIKDVQIVADEQPN